MLEGFLIHDKYRDTACGATECSRPGLRDRRGLLGV